MACPRTRLARSWTLRVFYSNRLATVNGSAYPRNSGLTQSWKSLPLRLCAKARPKRLILPSCDFSSPPFFLASKDRLFDLSCTPVAGPIPSRSIRRLHVFFKSNSVTIAGYVGTNSVITIPSSINSLPVTGIGDYAFDQCSNLANVTLPIGVTNIGMMRSITVSA